MKKIILIITLALISTKFCIAQFGYKDEYKTIDGVIIKYKYAHEKIFDKSSPINLRIKFTNTNDYAVEISFRIIMESDFTNIKKSELVDICVPKKISRSGKLRGLNFETGVNDISLFLNKEIEWYFEPLTIEKTDKCISIKEKDNE